MIPYEDLTDCPICPQLATDRDDALAELAALTAANAKLLDAARAFDELAICYRIGKRPSEKLFKRLAKARETLNAAASSGQALAEAGRLLTPEDRVVLDAARKLAEEHVVGVLEGRPVDSQILNGFLAAAAALPELPEVDQ